MGARIFLRKLASAISHGRWGDKTPRNGGASSFFLFVDNQSSKHQPPDGGATRPSAPHSQCAPSHLRRGNQECSEKD